MIEISEMKGAFGVSADRRNTPGGRLRIPKASELLADHIKGLIVSGALKEGDHLPAESNLMEQFDVSRPTIREAYRILEAERLVTVARGAKGGAIVHAPSSTLITDYALLVLQAERATVKEVYLARNAFEPALIRLIAENDPDRATVVLRDCLEVERQSVDDARKFSQSVAHFHRTLIELSGNRPMAHLYGCINVIIEKHQTIVSAMRIHGFSSHRENFLWGLKSHQKLIDLIASQNIDQAEAHWREHNEKAYESWIEGFEETTILEIMSDSNT